MQSLFFQAHKKTNYHDIIASLINCYDSSNKLEMSKTIFVTEAYIHRGNISEIYACLKKLGTNSNTQFFFQCLINRRFIYQDQLEQLKSTTLFAIAKFIFISVIQIIIYSWDVVKDLYFLAFYCSFGQISEKQFSSFDSQVFLVLIVSILLPNLLNIVVLLLDNQGIVLVRVRKCLVLMVFLSVSVTSYVLNKTRYMMERLKGITVESLASSVERKQTSDSQLRLAQHEYLLMSLNAKLKTNEGVYESTIQAVILMVTVAVRLR